MNLCNWRKKLESSYRNGGQAFLKVPVHAPRPPDVMASYTFMSFDIPTLPLFHHNHKRQRKSERGEKDR
jgi:hypothetical protein